MVGRKTSARCDNCRKRKIKCDLLEPACTPCLKSGFHCPGYNTHARFLNVDPGRLRTIPRISRPRPQLLSETDVLRNEYVDKLTNGQLTVRFWLTSGKFHGSLTTLSFIPKRLGESKALDDAVRCVCSTPSTQTINDPTIRNYLRALNSLQNALNDGHESMSSGTLTAATLLYIHEIYSNPFQQSWMVHADGVIKLLEARGPNGINTDLDKSIFCGQAGTIFLNAIQRRKPCFLAEPKWNALLRRLVASRANAPADVLEKPSIISLSMYLPGLLCNYEDLPANPSHSQVLQLAQGISQLRAELWEWRVSNDSLDDQAEHVVEVAKASANPLNYAFKLSSVMFLVLSNYIYVDLLGRSCGSGIMDSDDSSNLHEVMIADPARECLNLARIAVTRWEAVKSVDPVAAWACGTTQIILFGRALKVPSVERPEMQTVRRVAEDLHKRLSEAE